MAKKFNAEEAKAATAEALEAVKAAPDMEAEAVLGLLLEAMAGRKSLAIRYKRDLQDGTGYQVRFRTVGPFVCLRETRKGVQLLAQDSIYEKPVHFNLEGIKAAVLGGDLAPVGKATAKDKDGEEYEVVPYYPVSWTAARWAKTVRWARPEDAERLRGYSRELVVGVIPYTQ